MENQFFVDSEFLSPEALKRKHRLETDPSSRTDHMAYMPGMEQIRSDIMDKVMGQVNAYDPSLYTAKDVRAALQHETVTVEDFKALLSPAAEPFLEEMAQRARIETSKHFGNTVYLFTPLYIANYCENYCIYCGFNCYNHIQRMKLTPEQMEHEMKVIADSGMEEILILTGESRSMSSVEYIGRPASWPGNTSAWWAWRSTPSTPTSTAISTSAAWTTLPCFRRPMTLTSTRPCIWLATNGSGPTGSSRRSGR